MTREDREKILNRILVLKDMIKRDSTPDGEKETAQLMLRKLMTRYRITEDEIKASDKSQIGDVIWELSKSSYRWELGLAKGLGQIHGYDVLSVPGKNIAIIVGFEDESDIHAQIFYSVRNQMIERANSEWDSLPEATKQRKNAVTFKREFCTAATITYIDKLVRRIKREEEQERAEQREAAQNQNQSALVVTSDSIQKNLDDMRKWAINRWKKIETRKPTNKRRKSDPMAQVYGAQAGKEIEDSRGLND